MKQGGSSAGTGGKYSTRTLSGKVAYLDGKGIPGASTLLKNLKAGVRGARYQAKRALFYYERGLLKSIEHSVNGGQVDLLLRNGMQVEAKAWWVWNRLSSSQKTSRLRDLTQQVNRYLKGSNSRLRIEFEYTVFDEVQETLKLLSIRYGERLKWSVRK